MVFRQVVGSFQILQGSGLVQGFPKDLLEIRGVILLAWYAARSYTAASTHSNLKTLIA
jgi:hypothetical protein